MDQRMTERMIERIMKSEEEDKRIRWRDRTIENLGIRQLGWSGYNWTIF